jgi:flagellar motility protein MotE (MotC chaperone)
MSLKKKIVYSIVTLFIVAASGAQVAKAALGDMPGADDGDETQLAETEIGTVQERRIIVQLREQKIKNEQLAQDLQKEKIELNLLRIEVDKKLDELKALRVEVSALLEEKSAQEQVKVQELSQMYNKMDPAKAAVIIGQLDQELAIGILGNMKSKSAGKVLANVEGEKAAQLSAAYATLKED